MALKKGCDTKLLDCSNLLQGVSGMSYKKEMGKQAVKDLLLIPEQKCGFFHLNRHYISFTSPSNNLSFLTKEEQDTLRAISSNTLKPSPVHLHILEKLILDHPGNFELKNLLTFCYLKRKKVKKADKLIISSYKTHPENIIARINYGDYCLRTGQPQEIPKIFENTYDLTLLYPERKTFHVAEFRGFMVVMGFYHLALRDQEKAICYHYLAARVDSHHPGVTLLGRRIYRPPLFSRFFSIFKYIKKF